MLSQIPLASFESVVRMSSSATGVASSACELPSVSGLDYNKNGDVLLWLHGFEVEDFKNNPGLMAAMMQVTGGKEKSLFDSADNEHQNAVVAIAGCLNDWFASESSG